MKLRLQDLTLEQLSLVLMVVAGTKEQEELPPSFRDLSYQEWTLAEQTLEHLAEQQEMSTIQ